jgi:hypothetical protein
MSSGPGPVQPLNRTCYGKTTMDTDPYRSPVSQPPKPPREPAWRRLGLLLVLAAGPTTVATVTVEAGLHGWVNVCLTLVFFSLISYIAVPIAVTDDGSVWGRLPWRTKAWAAAWSPLTLLVWLTRKGFAGYLVVSRWVADGEDEEGETHGRRQ